MSDYARACIALCEGADILLGEYRPGRYAGLLKKIEKNGRKAQAAAKWKQQQSQREKRGPRPLCGAATRAGGSCRARCVSGRSRCRMHGGLSTGPKSEAGRQAIAESNRRRAEQRRANVARLMAEIAAAKAASGQQGVLNGSS